MSETYKKVLNELKLQKNRALNGVMQGSWILCLESIEDAPVEVVYTQYANSPMLRRAFKNLEEACKVFPKLDNFNFGMKGNVDGKPAIRFEDQMSYERLSS